MSDYLTELLEADLRDIILGKYGIEIRFDTPEVLKEEPEGEAVKPFSESLVKQEDKTVEVVTSRSFEESTGGWGGKTSFGTTNEERNAES